jgi:hypothetical protein
MSELELAIEYLKKRAISTEKVKKLQHLIAVNPTHEVEAVLEMVKNGEFKTWYDKMKTENNDVFP